MKAHLETNVNVGRRISRMSVPLVLTHLTFVVHLKYLHGDIVCKAIQRAQVIKQSELGCGSLIILLRA